MVDALREKRRLTCPRTTGPRSDGGCLSAPTALAALIGGQTKQVGIITTPADELIGR